jgi:hypothetical protein
VLALSLVISGLAASLVLACTVLAPPIQCVSDDDCARFSARCDVSQGVCAEPETSPSAVLAGDLGDSGRRSGDAESYIPQPPAVTADAVDASADAPADAGPAATLKCGGTTCPVGPDSVCCIEAAGPTCKTAADCTGSKIVCDGTDDCTALGMTGTICCAYNDGANLALLRTACVQPADCDANGPQDQLCSLKGPATQCAVATPGHQTCTAITYSNTPNHYAICAAP